MSKVSSWIKVAQGFQLVAQAASKIAIKESSDIASTATKHGFDLAKSARNATSQFTNNNVQLMNQIQNRNQDIHGNNDRRDIDKHDGLKNQKYNEYDGTSITTSSVNNNSDGNKENHQSITENIILSRQPLHYDTTHNNSIVGSDINNNINNESSNQQDKQYENNNSNNISDTGLSQSPQELEDRIQRLKEGKAVPSTRIGRAMGFASLGIGLAVGTAFEVASRVVSNVSLSNNKNSNDNNGEQGSIVTNDANSDRLARTLCRMRGAALKLGQMLSIQDETLLAPPLAKALEQVRQGADAMPLYQLQAKMKNELGEDWKNKFVSFDDYPFAAASIGQVHRATIAVTHDNGQKEEKKVVVKCQYPGVADSIDSDLNNLSMIVKMTGLMPKGLFIDNVLRVGRDELVVECDYSLEARNQERFRKLIRDDEDLARENFKVPAVCKDLSTRHVLTSEFCPGGTIDKVAFLDQSERNRIAKNILRLTMKELFVWRFMQTDPNWGNFLYDVGTGTTYLIDFGSARDYSKSFVDGYLRIVWANANKDTETLMSQSQKMGFLTGEENEIMINAHKMSGFTVGEPFATDDEYDFAKSGITGRMSEHASPFLQHRLTPPPEEVYTLHRKLAGTYNLCIKLGAKIKCRDLLEDVMNNHVFEDGEDHPLQKM